MLSPSGSENHGRDRVAYGVEGKRKPLLGVQHEAEQDRDNILAHPQHRLLSCGPPLSLTC